MPLILIAVVISMIFVTISVLLARRDNMGWLKSKGIDCVLFVLTFVSFVFSVGISGRLAIYVSDYNTSVDVIMGGLILNLALFFVPAFLFVASLILAVRLIRRAP